MTPCPDEDALNALASGLLAKGAASAIEAHVSECDECSSLLEDIGWSSSAGATNRSVPPATAELPLCAGDRMGRYVVRSIIGQGGMGTVYLAEDPELGRHVALKVLRAGRAPGPAERDRLSREARTMAKLADPGIVTVFDAGDADGRFYIAMQLVEGETLASWLTARPRRVDEIVSVFRVAGRALAAAHAAGVVHRDFKPENVLIDLQGRALVTDFGVAARLDDGAPAAADADGAAPDESGDRDAARANHTRHVVGTPRYMAPEQHERADAAPASDQYGFCVSLYEALAARPPFDTDRTPGSLDRLLQQKLEGPPPIARPGGPVVPERLRRVVERGLAPRVEDRFDSMNDLVLALDRAMPTKLWTWGRGVAAIVVAGLGGVAAIGWMRRAPPVDPCAHPEVQLEGVWDSATRAALRTAFAASGRSYAADTASRVSARLDAYTSEWSTMRREVCVASGAGKARVDTIGLRDLCLDRKRSRLAALTRLLTDRPDGEVVDKAVSAVADLQPIASCADAEALWGPQRRPEDPVLRARVDELERSADEVEASYIAGRNAEGLALGVPLLAEATRLSYAPLRAEVQLEVGELRAATGDYAGARKLLRDAAASAADGHDDKLEAKAWARLLFLISENQQRLDEAAVVYELGGGPVARAHDSLSEAAWLSSAGAYLGRIGSYDASKAAYQRVIDLREAALGVEHPLVGAAYHNMGSLLNERAEWAEAKVWYERALAVKERTLGPDHPSVALSLNNLGVALAFTGDERGALALYDRALRIWERALGPDHPRLATVLTNIGEARLQSGDARRAVPLFERALAIRERALGPSHPDVSSPLCGLGRAKVQLGELDAAEPLLRRALALKEKALGPLNQELALPLLALGELELDRAEPARALALLDRALALRNPKRDAAVHAVRAAALWQTGEQAGARVEMEAARASYAHVGHERAVDTCDAWLAAHPLP